MAAGFDFQPARVRITNEEILADLHYPARPQVQRRRRRPVERRPARRRVV
jgi:hypothetical protein